MGKKEINTLWDRESRNNINHNFEELYTKLNSIVGTISEEAVQQIIDSAKINWLAPVATKSELPSTANIGDAVMVSENGAGVAEVYRYNGSDWELIQEFDPTAINELDDRLQSEINLIKDSLKEKANSEGLTEIVQEISEAKGEFDSLKEKLDSLNVNVKDFGAVGDGTTDDTESFQRALNLSKTNKSVNVRVPAGVYRMTNELIIYSNTNLTVDNSAVINRDHDMYMILNGDRGFDFNEYEGNGNISISGGTWNMGGEDHEGATCFCFGHARNLIFKNLTILDVSWSHGIEINACKDVLIDKCSFKGYHDPGDRSFSEAIQLDLMKSTGVFNAFGSYDHTPCRDITIRGCYFGESDRYAAWGRGIGSHSSTIGKWQENIYIINNFFYNTRQWAVRPYAWNNVKVLDNFIIDCGGGIGAANPTGSTDQTDENGNDTNQSQDARSYNISGNTFHGGGAYGVAVYFYGQETGRFNDIDIAHNKIIDYKNTGIHCNFVNYLQVIGNNLSNLDNHGVWGAGIVDVTISLNSIHAAGQLSGEWQGFRVTTSPTDRIVFTGNRVSLSSGENNVDNGAYFSSGVSNLSRYGNLMPGVGLLDNSIAPVTDASDVI
ncbi:right-handed parallel beta-helix repeat-containing protein [Virgibacillus salexigens]|uniref:Pectate lyase superfamily protein domain-containing protein n=1 Tax=Virgibacillus kapii TaxID=1638645 RepID=A0ABQ2D8Q8_9BACI|nr:right-handed parallel beta-helix repeat-containing protein [Virgibacillus kapii]GGJ49585.1 hypothetical protein GCM10007111_09670 [Virgibacillus kapii]